MLHEFLATNRNELIVRCQAKVACRSAPHPTPKERLHGVPRFLGQLIETLRLEETAGGLERHKETSQRGAAERRDRARDSYPSESKAHVPPMIEMFGSST